jgi:hypothetical protein
MGISSKKERKFWAASGRPCAYCRSSVVGSGVVSGVGGQSEREIVLGVVPFGDCHRPHPGLLHEE